MAVDRIAGMTDYLTLEGHAEAAESLVLGGAGAVLKLGRLGVVNGAWTEPDVQPVVTSSTGGINNTRRFSVTTQHSRRNRGFGNWRCTTSAAYNNVRDPGQYAFASLSRNTDQYSLTFTMGGLWQCWRSLGLAQL